MILEFLPITALAAGKINSLLDSINSWVSQVLKVANDAIFFSIGGMPLIIILLLFAGVFFTLQMKFVNVRAFKHAIDVVRGKYDDFKEEGEVSHFQALAIALSATVGIGNVASAAVAIALGGPGACFWLTVGGLLGMSTKFVECTLGHKYRIVKPDGTIVGGPMYYLSAGLAEVGQKSLGKILAAIYSLMGIFGILVAVAILQSNQSLAAVTAIVPSLADYNWIYGAIVAGLVGLVIIGGLQRLARVAGVIAPLMCGIYILASLWVLAIHFTAIPEAIATIFKSAFSFHAVGGGFAGALIQGLRRSAFSNEAGTGTAAIAHAVARTDEPVREGIVTILEPFIDTVIICNLTALVVIVTGAYNNPEFADFSGTQLASAAFGEAISWFPYLLAVVIFFFAFSTIISQYYYGHVCWSYLLGDRSEIVFQVLFLGCILLGSVASSQAVIEFGDAFFLVSVLPNLLGIFFLSNQVAVDLEDYLHRLHIGRLKFSSSRIFASSERKN
ncbi:MAG: alanine:cation symporter family protein [Hormoscilla sp. GUM202]|nr:alanine:cation symporter family protein [Hormoscilla sp. GUM202]